MGEELGPYEIVGPLGAGRLCLSYAEETMFPQPFPGYEILENLGHNALGDRVYEARDLQHHRLVILKTPGFGPDRLLDDAQLMQAARHANIVELYEVLEYEGRHALVLEFVPGRLPDRLNGSPWAPHQAAHLMEKVARGVDAIHRTGHLHRFLCPAEILLTDDGEPKITGLQVPHDLVEGQIIGGIAYMAPEQPTGPVGPAADVYALGAILYELITGRRAFQGARLTSVGPDRAWQILHQVSTNEPVRPRRVHSGVPRDLERICLKCLEKQPDRRYPTAKALADDLHRFLLGEFR